MKFHPVALVSILGLLLAAGCGGKGGDSDAKKSSKKKSAEETTDVAESTCEPSSPCSRMAGDEEKVKPENTKAAAEKPENKEPPEPEENTVASKESVIKVKRLLRRWYSEVAIEREEAWEGLKDMGDLATPALIEVVKTGKPKLKRFAITAIGLLKDKLGAEVVRGALADADSEVRWSAARAAGEIGDTEAKPALAKLVKDDKIAEVRYYAAYSLASMDGKEAFDYFKGLLKTEKAEDRSRALRALGKYGKGKYTSELVASLKDKEGRVRLTAVIQLDRSRKKEGIPGLIVALEDEHRDVCKRARSALERLTGQEFGRDKGKWDEWWKANGKKFKVPAAGPKGAEPIKFANAPAITGEADFKKNVTDSKGLVAVVFFSTRGKNCRKFAPTFDKLAKEYKGKVTLYNCPAGRPTMAIIRKLGVRSGPTTVIFKDGKKLEMIPGLKTEAEIKKALDENLAGTREGQLFPDIKDTADFKTRVLDAKGLVLVDYHAEWCTWCYKLTPLLNKLQREYKGKLSVVGVDTVKQREIAKKYKVRGLPMMTIFKAGKPVETIKGYKPEDQLKAIIDKHLGEGGDK